MNQLTKLSLRSQGLQYGIHQRCMIEIWVGCNLLLISQFWCFPMKTSSSVEFVLLLLQVKGTRYCHWWFHWTQNKNQICFWQSPELYHHLGSWDLFCTEIQHLSVWSWKLIRPSFLRVVVYTSSFVVFI